MKTGLIVAAVATAALTAAGCSSSAHSGTETFTGTTTSTANHPLIPLKATGLFDDTGSIALTGNGGAGSGVLKLSNGNLTVHHSKAQGPQQPAVNKKTCQATFAQTGTWKVLSGTGDYQGYTGHGVFKVAFSATFHTKPNGQCNLSRNSRPMAGTSRTTFLATGTITK